MPLFEEVRLDWGGKAYAIPPDQVMKAIAKVEDVITLVELSRQVATGEYKLVRVAQAYGALLRHAGAPASDEEVYLALFPKKDGDQALRAVSALNTLLVMMVPPSLRKAPAAEAGAEPAGKLQAAATPPTAA